MRRRICITAAAGAFAFPALVRTQTSRTWRVCSAHTSAAAAARPFEESFLDALRELGFERGHKLEYAVRNADGDAARLPGVVDELLPKMKTLAVLLDPGVTSSVKVEQPVHDAARTKGARAVTYWARNRATLEQAFLVMERDRPDALLQPAVSGILYGERRFINDSVLRLRADRVIE